MNNLFTRISLTLCLLLVIADITSAQSALLQSHFYVETGREIVGEIGFRDYQDYEWQLPLLKGKVGHITLKGIFPKMSKNEHSIGHKIYSSVEMTFSGGQLHVVKYYMNTLLEMKVGGEAVGNFDRLFCEEFYTWIGHQKVAGRVHVLPESKYNRQFFTSYVYTDIYDDSPPVGATWMRDIHSSFSFPFIIEYQPYGNKGYIATCRTYSPIDSTTCMVTQMTYNKNLQIKERTFYAHEVYSQCKNKPRHKAHYTYTYDTTGLLVSSTYQMGDNERVQFEYSYKDIDEQGNWTTQCIARNGVYYTEISREIVYREEAERRQKEEREQQVALLQKVYRQLWGLGYFF